jgi:RimJ/RimL family protein N-acetyltransferase
MNREVRLRDVIAADLEVFFEHQRDPKAVQRANFPARERDVFFDHWNQKVLGNESGAKQTVTVDGEPAGNVVAWTQGDKRFIGYWLGREFWGGGIGTRAVTLFLELEKSRPLYAETAIHNTASTKLLERCGFSQVETGKDGDFEYILLVLN